MMRGTGNFAKLGLCLLLIVSASVVQAMEVNINFLLGSKGLDSDDWGSATLGFDADSQPVFGVETTFGATSWPVAIALDYIVSAQADDVLVTIVKSFYDQAEHLKKWPTGGNWLTA